MKHSRGHAKYTLARIRRVNRTGSTAARRVILNVSLRLYSGGGGRECLAGFHGSEKVIPIVCRPAIDHACPGVELNCRGADEVHAVNSGGSAEHLSSGPWEGAVRGLRLWYGLVRPVVRGVLKRVVVRIRRNVCRDAG